MLPVGFKQTVPITIMKLVTAYHTIHIWSAFCYFQLFISGSAVLIHCNDCFPIRPCLEGAGVLSRWTGQAFPGEIWDGEGPASPASGRLFYEGWAESGGKNKKTWKIHQEQGEIVSQKLVDVSLIDHDENLEKFQVGNYCQHMNECHVIGQAVELKVTISVKFLSVGSLLSKNIDPWGPPAW